MKKFFFVLFDVLIVTISKNKEIIDDSDEFFGSAKPFESIISVANSI